MVPVDWGGGEGEFGGSSKSLSGDNGWQGQEWDEMSPNFLHSIDISRKHSGCWGVCVWAEL